MKFHIPSMLGSLDMAYIKKRDGRTDEPENNMLPSTFSKLGA